MRAHVGFPLDSLDLSAFVDFPISSSYSRNRYRLLGVVVHNGSELHQGHYISFVRAEEGAEWILCDDENVELCSVSVVAAAEAYVLLYSLVI